MTHVTLTALNAWDPSIKSYVILSSFLLILWGVCNREDRYVVLAKPPPPRASYGAAVTTQNRQQANPTIPSQQGRKDHREREMGEEDE
jgi:hypothetical protein